MKNSLFRTVDISKGQYQNFFFNARCVNYTDYCQSFTVYVEKKCGIHLTNSFLYINLFVCLLVSGKTFSV